MKIGVFDSGVGGKSLLQAITKALPDAEVIIKDDRANLPYGNKSAEELIALVKPKMQEFTEDGVDVLVVACNTLSTTIIEDIRHMVNCPVIAVVPMIKPAAALTKSGVITVCATPATLASPRYAELVAEFAADKTILTPDCSEWAMLIESDLLADEQLEEIVNSSLESNSDVIVLGCTHYHWIYERLVALADGRLQVIYPQEPVIRQLVQVVEQLG